MELANACNYFRKLPQAGGVYDQDQQLMDAVYNVNAIMPMVAMTAEQLFKQPKALKELRRIISRLADDESY